MSANVEILSTELSNPQNGELAVGTFLYLLRDTEW